jgi:hypothetical protein
VENHGEGRAILQPLPDARVLAPIRAELAFKKLTQVDHRFPFTHPAPTIDSVHTVGVANVAPTDRSEASGRARGGTARPAR